MKTRYIILVVLLFLLGVAGIVVYRTFGSLDQIILAAIERYGSEITQSEVTLDKVVLDVSKGQAALIGLNVGNPDGYETDYAIKLDQARLTLDIGSITRNPIIISEILIQKPAIIYELASGGSNIDSILNNVKAYTGGEQKSEETVTGPKMIRVFSRICGLIYKQ